MNGTLFLAAQIPLTRSRAFIDEFYWRDGAKRGTGNLFRQFSRHMAVDPRAGGKESQSLFCAFDLFLKQSIRLVEFRTAPPGALGASGKGRKRKREETA